MSKFKAQGQHGLLLEAEVSPSQQAAFESRYFAATGKIVSAGLTKYYQSQPNKWGSELRVYFNDPGMAASLANYVNRVEHSRSGYRSGTYNYRINDNDFWWKLVECQGMRLGVS